MSHYISIAHTVGVVQQANALQVQALVLWWENVPTTAHHGNGNLPPVLHALATQTVQAVTTLLNAGMGLFVLFFV